MAPLVPLLTANQRRLGRAWLLAPSLVYVLLLLVLPLASVLSGWALSGGALAALAKCFKIELYRDVLLNTALLAALVSATCALLAYPVVYYLVHATGISKRLLLMLIIAGMLMSPLVRTYVWALLLQRSGPLNQFLLASGVVSEPLRLLHSRIGVVIGMTHVLLPFMIVAMWSAVRPDASNQLQVAVSLGSSNTYYFFRVFLPETLAGLSMGALAVFLLASSFYITPEILGGGRGDTMMFTSLIEEQVNVLGDWEKASALSTLFVVSILVLVACFVRLPALRAVLKVGDTARSW